MSIQSFSTPIRALENGHFTRAQALSLSLHIALIALLLIPAAGSILRQGRRETPISNRVLAPLDWISEHGAGAKRIKRDGSGGDRTQTDPTAGRLPRFDWQQFAPPKPVPPKNARLAMEPTLIGPPNIQPSNSDHPNWGDPRRTLITLTAGPGARDGVGDKCCGSIGNTAGRGIDEDGGAGAPAAGARRHGSPLCIYCPNPVFSDEAVKTRHQGKVLLRALVTADGRVTSISVVRGLGMGLDENAVAKVKTWRLTPARGPNGQPAAVWTLIEVVFRQH